MQSRPLLLEQLTKLWSTWQAQERVAILEQSLASANQSKQDCENSVVRLGTELAASQQELADARLDVAR